MEIKKEMEIPFEETIDSTTKQTICKLDELEMIDSDNVIEDEKEYFQEVDEKKDQGPFKKLSSFIKVLFDDDEKSEGMERKPAHSQATEDERSNSQGKNHDLALQNKVEEMHNALDKLTAKIQEFKDKKANLEERNTNMKSAIQNDMSKEDGGNDKEKQKDKPREISQNNKQIEKLNSRIAVLLKRHQQLRDKIEDIFDQEDEQEVRADVMKGLVRNQAFDTEVNNTMPELGAEVYQERLENLNNAINQNNKEVESVDKEIEGIVQSISSGDQNGHDHQIQLNQLLDKKELLEQESQSNRAIIGILTQDAKEGGFVGNLIEGRNSKNTNHQIS